HRSPTPEAPVREVPDVVEASQSQLEHYERGPVGDVETPREPGRSSEPNSVSRPEQEPNVWVPGPPAFTTDRGGAGDGAVDHGGLPSVSEPWQSAFTEPVEGTAAGPDTASGEPQQEDRVASTTEMTPAEMAQLRQALAEDPEKGRQIAASVRPGEVVEIPELDLDDPQLSERDRELLRELHAELAARERADATR